MTNPYEKLEGFMWIEENKEVKMIYSYKGDFTGTTIYPLMYKTWDWSVGSYDPEELPKPTVLGPACLAHW